MRSLVILFCTLTLLACGSGESGTAGQDASSATTSESEYTLEPIAGSDLVKALKYAEDGTISEQGYFLNNLPEGTWLFYEHTGKEFPKRIATYHRGAFQGPYLELTENGAITLQAHYENNELHGPWGSYKFSRPLKTAHYKHGLLDGVYREYTEGNGKLQKEIHYKDGKEHGIYRFYNEEGAVTLEYTYENGERVSGGIVEQGAAE